MSTTAATASLKTSAQVLANGIEAADYLDKLQRMSDELLVIAQRNRVTLRDLISGNVKLVLAKQAETDKAATLVGQIGLLSASLVGAVSRPGGSELQPKWCVEAANRLLEKDEAFAKSVVAALESRRQDQIKGIGGTQSFVGFLADPESPAIPAYQRAKEYGFQPDSTLAAVEAAALAARDFSSEPPEVGTLSAAISVAPQHIDELMAEDLIRAMKYEVTNLAVVREKKRKEEAELAEKQRAQDELERKARRTYEQLRAKQLDAGDPGALPSVPRPDSRPVPRPSPFNLQK